MFARTLLVVGLLLAACSSPPDPTPPPKPPQGRAETRSIRNVEAVGVPGNAIADKIDASLNAQEQAEQRLKRQAAQQSGTADDTAPPQ